MPPCGRPADAADRRVGGLNDLEDAEADAAAVAAFAAALAAATRALAMELEPVEEPTCLRRLA